MKLLNTPHRLVYLDSLRGIAALLVASQHFLENTSARDTWFLSNFNIGQIGVVVFFILSGMVIPYSLGGSEAPIRRFFISRFFRLYPAYWLSVSLAVLLAYLSHRSVPIGDILLNLTMLQSLFRVPDLFGVYWTLIIELMFYAACVFLCMGKVLNRTNYTFGISIFLLMAAIGLAIVRSVLEKKIPVAIPLAMSLMFFGSLWREASVDANKRAQILCVIWVCCFMLALPIICLLAYAKDYGHGESATSYIFSYSTALFVFLLATTKLKIRSRPIVFLGTISYSIYLLHLVVYSVLSGKISALGGFSISLFFSYLAMIIVISTTSYFLIEKPSIEFGRKIIRSRKTKHQLLNSAQGINEMTAPVNTK
jgi:peptidoglycan/LPS O-acetylase OafA/YrhL